MIKSAQVLIACALFSFSCFASSLTDQAIDKNLWDHPYWHKLLHYQKKSSKKFKSQADGEDFFLHPKGKVDPKAELIENIYQLFGEHGLDDPDQHPACRFPLRYQWLSFELLGHENALKDLDCPGFSSWKSRLGASGVSIIFASGFTNNPASMFGHTFLRIHRTQNNITLPPLLSYTANFAAETGSEGGMLYTIKGLFGGYPGMFSTFPYYQKVQQYNNLESRDLWEYELDATPQEIEALVLHLWELGSTHFQYFFADENCSYFLLSLLEVAFDSPSLRKHLPFFTIPVDTVKVMDENTSLLRNETFRPSLRREFDLKFENLSKQERSLFSKLKKTQNLNPQSPIQSQAKVLDAMIDYQAIEHSFKNETPFQKKLLFDRSRLGVSTEPNDIKTPKGPLQGHPTMRMGLGGSVIENKPFAHVDFRGVYHDLLDNPQGFDPTAQIQVLQSRIRFSLTDPSLTVDHIKAIEVLSLQPYQKYFFKPSWNIGFGWRKTFTDACFDCGVLYVEGGPGLSFGTSKKKRLYWVNFANAFFHVANWNNTGFQTGPSFHSQLLIDLTHHFRWMVTGSMKYDILDSEWIAQVGIEIQLDLGKRLALRFWGLQTEPSLEMGATLLVYF